ncbi:D-xylose-proton symporter-like 3, chloroplastic [Papaver somniferum]|uniref:D-xylose-proton symporter-like 3, chloroplastic n=1 Tax=Papaver somniferum TaxID=3469 RepID=UPI000E6F6F4F|nr:D-xylose-proton symporter-like 3, chloroplastic [Papaver somniferum]
MLDHPHYCHTYKRVRRIVCRNLRLLGCQSSPSVKNCIRAKKENLTSDVEIQSLVSDGGASVVNQDGIFLRNCEILLFLFPALSGLIFGYDIGAISGVAISLQSPKLSGTTWFNLSSRKLDLVVTGPFYGSLMSSVLVYPIVDFQGRRRELIIASVLYTLWWFNHWLGANP